MNDDIKQNDKIEKPKKKKTVIQHLRFHLKRRKNSFKKFPKKFRYLINPADKITIADIHATIFSIIIGFISAYALYAYSKVNEIELQVIEEASKINKFQVKYTSSIDRTLDTSETTERENIIEQLTKIGMKFSTYDHVNSSKEIAKTPLPSTSLEKGLLTLKLLSNLYTHYPFSTKLLDYSGNTPVKPVKLNTVEDVKKWVVDMEKTLQSLLWTLRSHKKVHQENFDAVESYEIELFKSAPENLKSTNKHQIQNYIDTADSAEELISSVNSLLIQIDGRKPNKAVVISSIVISIIGIVCGVLIPMINKEVKLFIVLWIPIMCYLVIFGGIMIILLMQ